MTCPYLRAPPLLLRAIAILRMSGRYSSRTVSSTFACSVAFSVSLTKTSSTYGPHGASATAAAYSVRDSDGMHFCLQYDQLAIKTFLFRSLDHHVSGVYPCSVNIIDGRYAFRMSRKNVNQMLR